jgi:hypothetical protein
MECCSTKAVIYLAGFYLMHEVSVGREIPDCKHTKTDFIRLMKVKIFLHHQNLKMKISQLKPFCSSWLALTQLRLSCALPPISWLFIVMYRLDSRKKLMKHCKKMAGNSHMRQLIT